MPTRIPTTFSRHNKTFIKCVNGTIVVNPMQGGDEYWISAPGHRPQRVGLRELASIVRQLVDLCGGPIPYMPYRDQFESARAVVNGLVTEADDPELSRIRKRVNKIKAEREAREMAANPEIQQADDPTAFVTREVARRAEPIKSLHIEGRRWYRRGAGGTYCTATIYINGQLVHTTPYQGGSGDHYMTLAKDWLWRNGYLEGLLKDERDPLWTIRDNHPEIEFRYNAHDVSRQRDL